MMNTVFHTQLEEFPHNRTRSDVWVHVFTHTLHFIIQTAQLGINIPTTMTSDPRAAHVLADLWRVLYHLQMNVVDKRSKDSSHSSAAQCVEHRVMNPVPVKTGSWF